MLRFVPLLALVLVAPAFTPSVGAVVSPAGAFTVETPAYEATMRWNQDASGVFVEGSLEAAGRVATFRQTLRLMDVFQLAGATYDLPVISAREGTAGGFPTLTLETRALADEISGRVTFTFRPDRILHESEFHFPDAGIFVPTVESVTRVAWSAPFALHGSALAPSTIALDDGRSLDQYGGWQDPNRYGLFHSVPGGAFVGHARVTQGDMANYLADGLMRATPSSSTVTTYFTAFLDAPTVGLGQGLWALDALVFLPDGSAPGAYLDDLVHFPGFGAFQPPALGDLAGRGQVVIALVDTGINPYHEDFRHPDITAHPSAYIEGYPADAPALALTFGSDYAASRNADDAAVWSQVANETLYWIPGTKIIGGYSVGTPPSSTTDVLLTPDFPERPIIDDQGHGTGVASVAAGFRFGACPECLIVAIEGTSQGVAWAATQPWIDIISNSYGPTGSVPVGDSHVSSRAAFDAGKSILYSAGNGYSGTGLVPDRNPSFTRPTSGPSWVITVGAASPKNDQDHHWHGVPVDVVSYGSAWPAASHDTITGEQVFSGTSCATPLTAGVEGALLLHARRALGDTREGPRGAGVVAEHDGLAVLPAGPLADGILTRAELEAVLMKTAIPTAQDPLAPTGDPTTAPGTPAGYVTEGYGLVNAASRAAGLDVLRGVAPLPDRSDVDAWIAATDLVRDAFWPPP